MEVTSHKCSCRNNGLGFSAFKFMWHSLDPRLQSNRILYFRCQRKALSPCHPILNYALLLHSVFFSPLSRPPSFISFSAFSQLILSSSFCGPHPLLGPLIPFILFNRVDPFLCLLSSRPNRHSSILPEACF